MGQSEIEMIPVVSKNVEAIGYGPETQTLAVKFIDGQHTYFVHDFDPADWEAFQAAESKGKFYYSQVRRRYGNITKG
jgi:hypothetical protein